MKLWFIPVLLLAITTLQLPAEIQIKEIEKLRGSSNQVIQAAKIEIPDKKAFVMLNSDYPVTPGDTYTVHYIHDLKANKLPFFIESDFTADLSFFGTINVKGLSFNQLKIEVKNQFLKAYPNSLPRVTIDSVGVFPILVKGEVRMPGYAKAWGFSRLTDIIADRLTPYSSIRNIEVISENGVKKEYDLYKAALASDLTKNPIIHPGDTVVVHRLKREIFVKGEVYREGSFQILPGENLNTVLDSYVGGITNLADAEHAYILRFLSKTGSTETIYIDLSQPDYGEIELRDMDVIVVPGRIEKLPLVFFEGALFMKVGDKSPISTRFPWPITENQRISTVLSNLPAGAITPVSDLERTFIIRRGKESFIPMDLHEIYYNHNLSNDIPLEEGDRIIIPTKFFTVMVGGAVLDQGPQPYVAGKTYIEFIQLAGGFDPELTTGKGVRILDRDGNRHGLERIIQPEDKIYIPKNSFEYLFNKRFGPIIITTAAIVSLILNINDIIAIFNNN